MTRVRLTSPAPADAAPSQPANDGCTTPRTRRTQAERVAESDRRMLEAATRLIARHGYTLTTLDAIGTEAGYSRGLAQHRFGNKDRLLEELIKKIAADHRERLLARMKGLRGLDALCCEIDCYLEGMDEPTDNSRAFFMLMHESLGPAPHIRATFAAISARWHHALARQIEAGQRTGQIRSDAHPEREAQLLIATARGLRTQSMLNPQTSDIATAIQALKEGLRARLANPTSG
ncbi:TetR/AcrR family transcriptional regulator [Variovorax sp. J22P271]|uniref:TetR/AcrR family transcriptional regulator n=1 Tax=Variovorax davisae TaxID=3053515 RepID=UPI00257585F0|nr:TetR/AcrR family transcriptional regulator [Variovorax sp. J22P271]MDM0033566.1 TetR/AcrR family transcriptional regulator [Variovorax sp. J22P271]